MHKVWNNKHINTLYMNSKTKKPQSETTAHLAIATNLHATKNIYSLETFNLIPEAYKCKCCNKIAKKLISYEV
jgi:hypothetical protein